MRALASGLSDLAMSLRLASCPSFSMSVLFSRTKSAHLWGAAGCLFTLPHTCCRECPHCPAKQGVLGQPAQVWRTLHPVATQTTEETPCSAARLMSIPSRLTRMYAHGLLAASRLAFSLTQESMGMWGGALYLLHEQVHYRAQVPALAQVRPRGQRRARGIVLDEAPCRSNSSG